MITTRLFFSQRATAAIWAQTRLGRGLTSASLKSGYVTELKEAFFWNGVWHLKSTSHWWLDRATVMHKLSDTCATYCQRSWHRHWRAAWYRRGWTTVIHCFTAHIPAVSRHYSACRTTPPGLFCKHRGSATQTRCCATSIGCRFVTESTTSWLW